MLIISFEQVKHFWVLNLKIPKSGAIYSDWQMNMIETSFCFLTKHSTTLQRFLNSPRMTFSIILRKSLNWQHIQQTLILYWLLPWFFFFCFVFVLFYSPLPRHVAWLNHLFVTIFWSSGSTNCTQVTEVHPTYMLFYFTFYIQKKKQKLRAI